jgi:hypothetical protein
MRLFKAVQKAKPPQQPEAELAGPPPDPGTIESGVATLQSFCDDVRGLCPEAFEGDLPGAAALRIYAYGGLIALSEDRGYAPLCARMIYRELLRRCFDFTGPFEAAGIAKEITFCASASDPSCVLFPLIQRGVQEFRRWQLQGRNFDAGDFKNLMSEPPWGRA